MNKIIRGGFLAGHRTYIISGAGIISAIAAYMVGDSDIFGTLQTVFTFGGVYFLRKSMDNTNESEKDQTCKKKSLKNSKTKTAR